MFFNQSSVFLRNNILSSRLKRKIMKKSGDVTWPLRISEVIDGWTWIMSIELGAMINNLITMLVVTMRDTQYVCSMKRVGGGRLVD